MQVECRRLDDFDVRANSVKIDAQGAELEILKGATTTVAASNVVVLEVWFKRRYKGQARLDEVQEWMGERGFIAAGFSALYFDNANGQTGITFADMVFCRPGPTPQGRKVVLVALIDACLDRLISHILPANQFRRRDRLLLAIIKLIGAFKFSAPQIY